MVAPQTNPDFVQAMQKATAIVTEKGGRTSHAAIVSRELGIPAVVGVKNATKILKEGYAVKVNGLEGKIYKISEKEIKTIESNKKAKPKKANSKKLKTLTRIYVNLSEPEQADDISKKNVDGIGLLRAEFIIAEIGVHPKLYIKQGKEKEFVDKLSNKLLEFAKAFSPRPVIYRATDFKTNEYRHLKGGINFEQKEENPMLGFRGASRYYNDKYKEGFALECKAVKKAREEKGLKNVIVMIPFCRTVKEADKVLKVMEENGLKQGKDDLQIYVMCEIPSNVILAKEFAKRFDGFSIGSNDLTQLILGVDRDSEELSDIFDERNEAVKTMIRNVIISAHEVGCKVGICGQAPSDYPDFAEFLVEAGIDSISLNPDSVINVKKRVAEVESKLPIKTKT